jgi:hypothetical protein
MRMLATVATRDSRRRSLLASRCFDLSVDVARHFRPATLPVRTAALPFAARDTTHYTPFPTLNPPLHLITGTSCSHARIGLAYITRVQVVETFPLSRIAVATSIHIPQTTSGDVCWLLAVVDPMPCTNLSSPPPTPSLGTAQCPGYQLHLPVPHHIAHPFAPKCTLHLGHLGANYP